jgi:hypothetical protein
MSRESFFIRSFVILTLGTILFSCRSTKELPGPSVKTNALSVDELLKNIEQNSFQYEDFSIRRVNCQYSDEKGKTSFTANLKVRKNQYILVSLTKLNIPVGRVLLTPDSVKYVNYLNQNYFKGNYDHFSKLLKVNLSFETIQSIIGNDANAIVEKINSADNELKVDTNPSEYILQNLNRKNPNARRYKFSFLPVTFSLARILIDDNEDNRRLKVEFGEFQPIGEKNYPGLVDLTFASPNGKVDLNLRYSGFSTEKIESFNFSIPSDYQKINVN